MVEKYVRSKLLKELGITPQALSQRAKRIKSKHGPMTTDEAVYVIAHTAGIDLSRHLPLSVIDRIRSLVPKEISPRETRLSVASTKKTGKKRDKSRVTYPLVKEAFINKAYDVGRESFPRLFVLENSIRNLVENTLSKVDKDWWNNLVPKDVQGNVQRTVNKEKKYPHRQTRGDKLILYSNFADLSKIIVGNMPHFVNIIVKEDWFKTSMDEIYMARNNLAHSILLTGEDISRINLFYSEWARVLNVAGIK